MRVVFVGAGTLTTMTARELLERGLEVVIIERDKQRIDEVAGEIAAGFIHGDGTKPDVMSEAAPRETDFLFCLTGNDHYNIIASLVGRSMGCKCVVTRIEDPSYEHICTELGLENVIVPDRTMAAHLTQMCEAGHSPPA